MGRSCCRLAEQQTVSKGLSKITKMCRVEIMTLFLTNSRRCHRISFILVTNIFSTQSSGLSVSLETDGASYSKETSKISLRLYVRKWVQIRICSRY